MANDKAATGFEAVGQKAWVVSFNPEMDKIRIRQEVFAGYARINSFGQSLIATKGHLGTHHSSWIPAEFVHASRDDAVAFAEKKVNEIVESLRESLQKIRDEIGNTDTR